MTMRLLALGVTLVLTAGLAACDTQSSGRPAATDAIDALTTDSAGDTAVGDASAEDTAAGDSVAGDSSIADASGACPAEPPIGVGACSGDAQCKYGQECCCGECHPSVVCSCEGGTWACYATDACLVAGCPDAGDTTDGAQDAGDPVDVASDTTEEPDQTEPPACPAEAPVGVAGCEGPAHCEYGEECCCGECHPSLVCDCEGGSWACYNTDACLIAGCPCHGDSDCTDGQACTAPDDPQACGFCQEPESTCTVDADCAETPGTVCDVPVTGCFCEPTPQCVPACGGDQGCQEGESCTGGHCAPTACEADGDCPAFFSCVTDASGHCERTTCSDDDGCGEGGFCVNGRCHGQLGLCEYPVP